MTEFFANGSLHFQEGKWRDDNGDVVEIAEVRHGEWIHSNRGFDMEGDYECSLCHSPSGIKHFYNGKKYKHCPDCGAIIDGGLR